MPQSAPFIFILFLVLFSSAIFGQENKARPLTIETTIETAINNYPSLRAAQAQARAAEAGVELANTAIQPKVDFLWQQNLASRNNVFGLLLPQSTIPAISGPVLGTGSFAPAFGVATGVLFSWEPFDFGARKASIDLARANSAQARSQIAVTQLDVAATAADAFLAVLAADQAVRAAQANIERLEIFSKAVHILVENQLRPGVDASRLETELAVAKSQLIQAQQNAALARTVLAEATGQPGTSINIDPGRILDKIPDVIPASETDFTNHPWALAHQAILNGVKARQNILARSYYPKFNWQAAIFARGSGAQLDKQIFYSKGLYPDTANWATGLSLSFSPTDIFGLRAKKRIEANNYAAEQARYDQTLQRLKTEEVKAGVMLEAAKKLALNTPLQLAAAQETETRIRARYQAELATITDVADAQRLLTQAEVDNDLARLSVWRALLLQAKARGDLKPFLDLLKK